MQIRTRRNSQRGLTLIEVLISIALMSTISLVVIGALSPWLAMKSKMDTERKLQDIRNGMTALYSDNAMAVDTLDGDKKFRSFTVSTVSPPPPDDATYVSCNAQTTAFQVNAAYFAEPPTQMSIDGYKNPWCIDVSDIRSTVESGTTLWYRNIAVISTGPDGRRDSTTTFTNGVLNLGGDDLGIVISGKEIQSKKLQDTLKRMTHIGQTYETYFTSRYLSNESRDIGLYYFSSVYDTDGVVASTQGKWAPTSTSLQNLGVAGASALTAWETDNEIELGNATESVNGIQVRSPAANTGPNALPYTALLRAKVPSPSNDNYVLQVVVGNY